MIDILNNFSEKDITYSLYGLLLGDGYYERGALINTHTNKQRFYCIWLENIFVNLGLRVNGKYNYIKKTTFGEKEYSTVKIWVPNRDYFENNNRFFNDCGKKVISNYVLNHINEFGLLLWFLDDGQFHVSFNNNKAKRFGYLNTQSFTYEENVLIRKTFFDRFNISLRIHQDGSGFKEHSDKVYHRLYFNAENFRKFFDIVRPFLSIIPKEFYYKFDMKYKPNRIKVNSIYSEKYNLIS